MKTVIIIGAGPAGLTAAKEILKHKEEYKVIILEESYEIGGISRTINYKGNRMDIGGHRFFSKDERVMKWWTEVLPLQGQPSFDDKMLGRETKLAEGGPDPENEDKVMLVRKRVSRIYYKRKFFDYPVTLKAETLVNMGFITTVKAGISYLYSVCKKRKEESLENFYINRFGKVLYSMFFEGYTEKLWGRHPREISADWGAQRVKGLSILAVIKDMFAKVLPNRNKKKDCETSLIPEFIYPKYGPGELWEQVAKDILESGGIIRKGAKVTEVHKDNSNKIDYVSIATEDGTEKVCGDIFLSSMPLKDLVAGMNDVPKDMLDIAEGLPYRDFVTVGLLVDKLNLVNTTKIKTFNGLVPDCWIYVQDTGVKLGRIQIFNNWSPYMVNDPEKEVWIGLEYFCNEGDYFWNMSDEECKKQAIQELKKMGVLSEKSIIKDAHREKVKKAYPAYFDTYEQIDKLISYLNQFDNLYCIGRNGQHRYNNMDHSMVTSFEAVHNIVNGIQSKDNIWNVNTEKEYHESAK